MASVSCKNIARILSPFSTSPHLDAALLMQLMLQTPCGGFPHECNFNVSTPTEKKLHHLIERRKKGEPIAYLTHTKSFWELDFFVNPSVLIPRPETEILVEWTLQHFSTTTPLHIADLGTGSGAIALSLAHASSIWQICATDLSAAALEVARENAQRYHLYNVRFEKGNWCNALPLTSYDLILSNPPYLSETDPHLVALSCEPQTALIAGKTGLEALSLIITEAKHYLRKGGWLCVEHAATQQPEICAFFESMGYQHIQSFRDLAGLPRMVIGQWQ